MPELPLLTFRARGRPITPPGADEHAPLVRVNLDTLVTSKLLAQTNSGGGKSYILRGLLEETAGRLPAIVIDPEGEFHTLREKFPFWLAAKHGGDVVADLRTAKRLTRKVMELGASIVVDLYELKPAERREWVAIWADEMTNLPRALWRPTLLVVDEAHTFAPERGHGESISLEPLINLTSLARKRGFCMAFATQRISKFHKDVAAELNNKLIGRTGLDVDVKRAGEELGMDKENRGKLRALEPGTWYCYGPAFPFGGVELLQGPGVETTHPKPGSVGTAATPAPAKVKAAIAELGDLPKEAAEEARTVEDLRRALEGARREIKRLERGAPAPVRQPDPEQLRAQLQLQITAAIDRARKQWDRDHETLARAFVRVLDKAAIDVAKVGAELARHGPNLVEFAQQVKTAAAKFTAERAGAVQSSVPNTVQHSVPRHVVTVTQRPAAIPMQGPGLVLPDVEISRDADGGYTGASRGDEATRVGGTAQRILDTLLTLEELGIAEAPTIQVGAFVGYSERAKTFVNAKGALKTQGLIRYGASGTLALTDEGRARAHRVTDIVDNESAQKKWREILGGGAAGKALDFLLEHATESIDRADVAAAMGYGHDRSKTVQNVLGRMKSLGVIAGAGGKVHLTELLFPFGR